MPEKIAPFIIVFIILLSFFLVTRQCNDKKVSFIFILLSVFVLAVFAGLRQQGVDPDYSTYHMVYIETVQIDNINKIDSPMEKGYLWLSNFTSLLFDNYYEFLTIFLFSSLLILSLALLKVSPYPLLSLIIYFSHYYLGRDFVAIRSAFSYSLVFFAVTNFSYDKKLIKYLLLIILASLFHKTALMSIFLPIVFYLFKKDPVLFFKICFPICLILAFFLEQNIIAEKVGFLFSGNSNNPMYERYFLSSETVFDLGVFNIVNLRNLILLLLSLKFIKDQKYQFIIFSFSLGSMALISFHSFGLLAARSLSQIVFLEIVIIPLLISKFKAKRLIFLLAICYAFIFLIMTLMKTDYYHYSWVL